MSEFKVFQRCHPLVREAMLIAKREGYTLSGLAERSGLNEMSIYRWDHNTTPNLTSFQAFVGAMNRTLAITTLPSEPKDKLIAKAARLSRELEDTFNQLKGL